MSVLVSIVLPGFYQYVQQVSEINSGLRNIDKPLTGLCNSKELISKFTLKDYTDKAGVVYRLSSQKYNLISKEILNIP